MPELTYPPQNPIWPPPGSIDSRVTRYNVVRVGPLGESFLDICNRFGIKFDDLMQFNFGLKRSEPHYFEKINWYLKNKLGCTKKTKNGNFIFSGGETIYIPARGFTFDPAPVNGTPPSRLKDHIVIEGGDAAFKAKIVECLDLLDSKAPQYSKWFSQYDLKISTSERPSGANFKNKAIDLAPLTYNADKYWVASVIIHETFHFWEYRSGHYKPGYELDANSFQLGVLQTLGAPDWVIEYMKQQDGTHADLNHDGKYDEKDYGLRPY